MNSEFKDSYPKFQLMPKSDLLEIAFIGRSNVGKSSLINMICQNKNLAKTSSTPGKTQTINRFLIDKKWYLVDLPGFGYAKTSKEKRFEFSKMISEYILKRESLQAVCILIDIRIPPQAIDLDFMEWCAVNSIPFIMIFTKCDKIKEKEIHPKIELYFEKMSETWEEFPQYIITSAEKSLGRDEFLSFVKGLIK